MVNRSKNIGTKGERDFVRYAQVNGFAGTNDTDCAQRIALNGSEDHGDVSLCPGIVVEVKAGLAAETASDAQVRAWLEETETERRNRGAEIGFLVRKRKAKGAAQVGAWHAHMSGWVFVWLIERELIDVGMIGPEDAHCSRYRLHTPSVEVRVDEALELIRRAGYGEERRCDLQARGMRR